MFWQDDRQDYPEPRYAAIGYLDDRLLECPHVVVHFFHPSSGRRSQSTPAASRQRLCD